MIDEWDGEDACSAIGWSTVQHEDFLSRGYGNVFASAGLDDTLHLWDARASTTPVATATGVHGGEAVAVAWSALDPALVATGGSDGAVRLFDVRCMGAHAGGSGSGGGNIGVTSEWGLGAIRMAGKQPLLAELRYHLSDALCVEFSCAASGVLLSAGADGVVVQWDLAQGDAARAAVVGRGVATDGKCMGVEDEERLGAGCGSGHEDGT